MSVVTVMLVDDMVNCFEMVGFVGAMGVLMMLEVPDKTFEKININLRLF